MDAHQFSNMRDLQVKQGLLRTAVDPGSEVHSSVCLQLLSNDPRGCYVSPTTRNCCRLSFGFGRPTSSPVLNSTPRVTQLHIQGLLSPALSKAPCKENRCEDLLNPPAKGPAGSFLAARKKCFPIGCCDASVSQGTKQREKIMQTANTVCE